MVFFYPTKPRGLVRKYRSPTLKQIKRKRKKRIEKIEKEKDEHESILRKLEIERKTDEIRLLKQK